MSSTSTSLLAQLRDDCPEAWERLTKLYGPLIYHWARKAGLQPNDAADVMQDVFRKLTRDLRSFRYRHEQDSFRAWLYVVVRHQVMDLYRKRNVAAVGGTNALQQIYSLPERPPEPTTVSGSKELNHLRRRAMQLVQSEFEGRTWLAFWRAVVEGDRPSDIAADMGVSVWTVYKAKARILKRLRDEFEGLF